MKHKLSFCSNSLSLRIHVQVYMHLKDGIRTNEFQNRIILETVPVFQQNVLLALKYIINLLFAIQRYKHGYKTNFKLFENQNKT